MKKKKLTGLRLNKKTISNFESSQIYGGRTSPQVCIPTSPKYTCNLSKGGGCDQLPTEAYNCTVDTIDLTNCGDTDPCNSATACA